MAAFQVKEPVKTIHFCQLSLLLLGVEVPQNKRPGYLILLSFWEQVVWRLSLAWFAEEGRILSKQTRKLPHVVFWEGVFGLHLLLSNGKR